MIDPIHELKVRAEILHARVQEHDTGVLKRLRVLSEFRRSPDGHLIGTARHQHCLRVIAAEWGFPGYREAKRALSGEEPSPDFGALLYPNKCCGHLNRWYKIYEEAAEVRKDCRGYLLGYRHQYVVVDRYFIETLGLDPDDPDWEALGFDWVRPAEITARTRLYSKLVSQLPREAA